MLLGNIGSHETDQQFGCLLDYQELDSINAHFKIHILFIDLGQHYFSPYPEKRGNFQQNSRPCRVWLYNANSYKNFNFCRNLMILHMFSTKMLRYKLVDFKRRIRIHSRVTDMFALLIG